MKYLYLVLSCLFMSACSVTQVHLHYVPPPMDRSAPTKTCARFVIPELPTVPATPIDEYSAVADNEDIKRVHVLVNYIEKLRIHISETKRQLNASYQKHLTDCLSE